MKISRRVAGPEGRKIKRTGVVITLAILMCVGFWSWEYIGFRLYEDLNLGARDLLILDTVKWVSLVSIPAGLLAPAISLRRPLKSVLSWVGLTLMGFLSTLLVLTVLRDLALAALIRIWPENAYVYPFVTAVWVIVGSLTLTLIGLFNARRIGSITRHKIESGRIKKGHGLKIAQISDLHIGPTIGKRFVQKVVQRVNDEKPDVIVITGDLVDGSVAELEGAAAVLRGLRAQHGVYVVLGNHDYYSGALPWTEYWRSQGFKVLHNDHDVIKFKGGKIVMAGVPDKSASRFLPDHQHDVHKALEGAPYDTDVVLLAHQPDQGEGAPSEKITLQLSGHTHNGQFFPWNLAVRATQPIARGFSRKYGHLTYVNRGTGYWGPPKRILSNSEISVFTMAGK